MHGRLDEVVPAPVRDQVRAAEAALSKTVTAGLPAPVRMTCAQRVVAVVGTLCGELSESATPGADNLLSAERCCGGASAVLAGYLGEHLIEKYGSAARACDLSAVREGSPTLRWRANDRDIAEVAAWLAGSAAQAEATLEGAAQCATAPRKLRDAAAAAAEYSHQAWAWLGGDSGGWP
ncbi:hypothetical protein [Streptomyces monomycini]|uniref:hypothetical protein n=1 Tax=Streptomyces monomycini TaxID=371720 RepID=UPI0004AADFA7|nr:hypothetical protein [Streptomyces monomycini]